MCLRSRNEPSGVKKARGPSDRIDVKKKRRSNMPEREGNMTAASVGNVPRSYTDYLQLTALRGARIGLLTAMLARDPVDAEVAEVVRGAVEEMKGQGAEIVEVSIPDLSELLTDRANGVPHHPTGFQVRPERLSGGASERSGTDSGRGARLRQIPPCCRDELA